METSAWWPGVLLAVLSGIILLLFLVTLLLHHVPVLEKWLSPVLTRIAPAKAQQQQQQQQQLRQPQRLSDQIQQQRQRSSQSWNNDVHHQLALAQQHPYQRNRSSRPCSLPCLPEEKMAYYSSGGSSPVASSVVAVAAAAAAQAAQAAAMPHRPHSFYPPLDDDDSGGEDDEDDEKLYTDDEEDVSIATVASAPAATSQSLGSRIHHKLNLALHSDGSEASNSSSSASAINDHADAPRRHYHRPSAHPVVRRHHRSSGDSGAAVAAAAAAAAATEPAGLRQRAARRDPQQQQLFDRDPSGVTHEATVVRRNNSNERWTRPTVHRQSSLLAETDCDESLLDMTDMSSTFGESDSLAGGTLRRPGAMLMGARSASVDAINKVLIELGITYSASTGKVAVRVIELRQLSQVGRNTSVQLRLLLLPDRKQRHKSKLRFVTDGSSVVIAETFVFSRIEPAELCHTGVRFRLYGSERLRRERILGEASVGLVAIGLETQREQPLLVTLDFKTTTYKKSLGSLGRSTSSSSSRGNESPTSTGEDNWPPEMIPPRQGIPELLLGLAYNGTTGRLSVEVLRASALRSWTTNRMPDVCVKLLLLSQTGQELGRAKTSLKKNSDGPTWLETFSFQVTLFQMADVTLLVSVVNKRSLKRRELLGWVSLGYDSPVEQQSEHWQEMREANGEQVCHWHALMPP